MTKDLARAFWIDHARTHTGTAAVHPRSRWAAYDRWSRHLLQEWTLRRIRTEGPRYRLGVDLGCGIGDWTARFAELCDEVHACDVSPDFVTTTRQRVPDAIVSCADLRDYRFPRRVEFVYAGAVLLYLSDADVLDVFERIRAATVPGALVIVRDYCTFGLGRHTVNEYSVHRHPRELLALADRARLACVEQRASPSMYGETMARGIPLLQWPLRALWRVATATWLRASHTFVLRA